MASPTTITVTKLSRLVATPAAPAIIDVRIDDDWQLDPRYMPGARRHRHTAIDEWRHEYAHRKAVVVCQQGQKLSEGVAAWLRNTGATAEVLEGGFEAWRDAGQLLVTDARLPPRDAHGRTVWVTRERPKIDRIACPWLIRRFIDPDAVFLFVKPAEVLDVADRFQATPFDIEGVFWSHREQYCTFDTMVEEFGLVAEPLTHLATIVRAADTGRFELAEQAAGFLAISLGLSRMFKDDLAQLHAGLGLYDALYRWCRDATQETHNWPAAATGQPQGDTSR